MRVSRGAMLVLFASAVVGGRPALAQTATDSAAPSVIGRPDAALAGHYYLSGVMETGSELLLKADGRFEWFVSYGAVDQVATGRWGRDGQVVTLVAEGASTPAMSPDQVRPWDRLRLRVEGDALVADLLPGGHYARH